MFPLFIISFIFNLVKVNTQHSDCPSTHKIDTSASELLFVFKNLNVYRPFFKKPCEWSFFHIAGGWFGDTVAIAMETMLLIKHSKWCKLSFIFTWLDVRPQVHWVEALCNVRQNWGLLILRVISPLIRLYFHMMSFFMRQNNARIIIIVNFSFIKRCKAG